MQIIHCENELTPPPSYTTCSIGQYVTVQPLTGGLKTYPATTSYICPITFRRISCLPPPNIWHLWCMVIWPRPNVAYLAWAACKKHRVRPDPRLPRAAGLLAAKEKHALRACSSCCLKGVSHEIFGFRFLSWFTVSSGPLSIPLGPFEFVWKFVEIFTTFCLLFTGVDDTGSRLSTL